MKFLLWEVHFEPSRLARVQWILFRLFKRTPKNPCGHTQYTRGYCCHQPYDAKYCDVINTTDRHEVLCKCCGSVRMSANHNIRPDDPFDISF